MPTMLTSKVLQKPIGLVQATSIVMVATLASAVFGLLREGLVAAQFGATMATDAYFFSFDLVVSLPEFMLSAIGASLIPIYARSKKDGDTGTFVNTVISAYVLFLVLVTAIMALTAPLSASTLAAGFDASGQQLITVMIRLLSPAVLLVGLWGLLKTILNADGEFFVSTISQVLQSLGVIIAVLLFAHRLQIFSLPVGILVASAVQVAWTAYWLKRKGFQFQFKMDFTNPRFRRYLALLVPSFLGGLIGYVEPIIDKSLASHLAEGTVASFSFAGRPMAIMTRIIIFSFMTALLPILSWETVNTNQDHFRASVVRILNMLLFVIVPASLLLVALRMPIIQVLFERGKFAATSSETTANIFAGLALGLIPMSIAVTLSTVFTSLEDTKTPAFWGAGSSLITKIVLSFILIAPLGAIGLALATSLKYVVSGALLLFHLRQRLQGIEGGYLARSFIRILFTSILAVGPVYLMSNHSTLSPVIILSIGTCVAVALYLALSMLLRVPELSSLQSFLLRSKGS